MSNKIVITNKRAYRDYEIEMSEICGIVLKGEDIKNIRKGKFNISGNYVIIENNELFLINGDNRHKLLATKSQIRSRKKIVEQQGYTLIVNKLFENVNGLFKVNLCVAKGKKNYDKRNDLKEKDLDRETWKIMKKY